MPNYHQPVDSTNYETVAASQTAQVMGGTGATGDFFNYLVVVPTSTTTGVISILDGSTSISVFAGGTGALLSLVPFTIPLGFFSVNGAWSVTTGAGLSVIAVGQFS